MSKYGVFFGPYFPIFSLNKGKHGPKRTPYLDTFLHTVVNCEHKPHLATMSQMPTLSRQMPTG